MYRNQACMKKNVNAWVSLEQLFVGKISFAELVEPRLFVNYGIAITYFSTGFTAAEPELRALLCFASICKPIQQDFQFPSHLS